ncbi:MAG: leucyl/phenylalanyl-tRNA--protein transferase [Deltaproteobacteria bacterium]|nr:leucyl/phenylalanyl-tRNA--protein transferase [Deltaproteobacteria bacterium]MBW2256478.1 leucyl/phenylalanyl-tRNA--protein transferase [Deltaproteobacteria bacterium]
MPVFRIPPQHVFPDPEQANPFGLLGVGGDLHPRRLLVAYRSGIFPWYSEHQPLLWWSPDPRMVLLPAELHVPRSLRKVLRAGRYTLSADHAFEQVIDACAEAPRPGQKGTWITPEMRQAYVELHRLGHAHSVEAWSEGQLAGGLYGVAIGRAFFGESMYAVRPDASKVAFVRLVEQLERWGYPLVDCQVHTQHLDRFGACEISRAQYLEQLTDLVDKPGRMGPWTLDEDLSGPR